MESASPAALPNEHVLLPPQSSRVHILDASAPHPHHHHQDNDTKAHDQGGNSPPEVVEEEAGRYAVAATDIAPGELVLVAAPSQTAMNLNLYRSALYLMAKTYAEEGGVEGTATAAAAAATSSSAAQKKPSNNKKEKGSIVTTASTTTAAAMIEDPFAAYDSFPSQDAAATTTATTSVRVPQTVPPRTPLSSYCASCFRPIAAHAYYVNIEDIKELSVQLCVEEEAREEAAAAAAATTTMAEDPSREDAATKGTKKKLKAKQAATGGKKQKEGSQQLIAQKLKEQRALLLEEYVYKHRMAAVAASTPLAQWEEARYNYLFTPAYAAQLQERIRLLQKEEHEEEEATTVVIGCPGCGVHCYCSYDCFLGGHFCASAAPQEGPSRIAATRRAECRVLRALFPLFMRTYYSAQPPPQTQQSRKASGGGAEALHKLQLPWAAPLLWTRQTSHEQSVEAQGMWLAALVLTQRAVEGFHRRAPAHVDAAAAAAVGEPETVEEEEEVQEGETTTTSASTTTTVDAHKEKVGDKEKNAAPSTTAKTYASDSIRIPAEALLIKKMKAASIVGGDGRRGAVEVLERLPTAASPSTTRETAPGQQQQQQQHFLKLAADLFDPCYDTSTHTGDAAEPTTATTRTDTTQSDDAPTVQLVRLPTYAEDTSQLISNVSVLSKEMRKTYQTYYRRFVKLFYPTLQAILKGLIADPPSSPPGEAKKVEAEHAFVTEELFLSICGAVQCNSFGIFTARDEPLAACLYPEAAFFNHSCSPNLCRVVYYGRQDLPRRRCSHPNESVPRGTGPHRSPCQTVSFFALRPIPRGEPLTICYINIEMTSTAERRMNLLMNYRFWCTCLRCGGAGAGAPLAAAAAAAKEEETEGSAAGGRQKGFGGFTDGGFCATDMCSVCAAKGYCRPLLPLALAYHRQQQQQQERESADHTPHTHNNKSQSDAVISVRECTICGARFAVDTTV